MNLSGFVPNYDLTYRNPNPLDFNYTDSPVCAVLHQLTPQALRYLPKMCSPSPLNNQSLGSPLPMQTILFSNHDHSLCSLVKLALCLKLPRKFPKWSSCNNPTLFQIHTLVHLLNLLISGILTSFHYFDY